MNRDFGINLEVICKVEAVYIYLRSNRVSCVGSVFSPNE